MRSVTALAVLAFCALAVPASAQATFGQMRAEGAPTVYVTDRSGQETRGQLVTLSEAEITIKTGALTKTFTADQVSLIERRGDSLKNGALAGAAFGVLPSRRGHRRAHSGPHADLAGQPCQERRDRRQLFAAGSPGVHRLAFLTWLGGRHSRKRSGYLFSKLELCVFVSL